MCVRARVANLFFALHLGLQIAVQGGDGNPDDLLNTRAVTEWLGTSEQFIEIGRQFPGCISSNSAGAAGHTSRHSQKERGKSLQCRTMKSGTSPEAGDGDVHDWGHAPIRDVFGGAADVAAGRRRQMIVGAIRGMP